MATPQMTHQQQADLYATCTRLWPRVRRAFDRVRLPTNEDWNDIRAAATARVFDQMSQYDTSRPLPPWVYTVMWRATANELRRFKLENCTDHKWKRRVLYPKRLLTKLVEEDEWGNEAVVVLPDRPTEDSITEEVEIDEFVDSLSKWQVDVLMAATAGRVSVMERELKLRNRKQALAALNSVTLAWRQYTDGEQVGAEDWKTFRRRTRKRYRVRRETRTA